MSGSAQAHDEFDVLFTALLDGEVSLAQEEQLSRILREEPAARERFAELMELHALLAWDMQCKHSTTPHVVGMATDVVYEEAYEPDVMPQDDLLWSVLEQDRQARWSRAEAEAHARELLREEEEERRQIMVMLRAGSSEVVPVRHIVIPRWMVYATAASIAVLLLTLASMLLRSDAPTNVGLSTVAQSSSQVSGPVATLVGQLNAQWGDQTSGMRSGAKLRPGMLDLVSGAANVRFNDGTTVILSGPCLLELRDVNRAVLHRGRMTAHVTDAASGFTIDTANVSIVDLGTEFGVHVDERVGETQVHVFDGAVSLHLSPADPPRTYERQVHAGVGCEIDAHGMVRTIPVDADAFTRETDYKAAVVRQERYERYRAYVRELQQDPRLIAFYTFEPRSPIDLILRNMGTAGSAMDGIIREARWSDGRFDGKRALTFSGELTSRVSVNIPGQTNQLTLCAWIQVDAFRYELSGLLMSEHWMEPGKIHWQIDSTGAQVFAVASRKPETFEHAGYLGAATPSIELGQWRHVAVVYDTEAGECRHYCDGKLIAQLTLEEAVPVEIGRADIGNWEPHTFERRFALRHFVGAMDELLVYTRALSDDEIAGLAEAGRFVTDVTDMGSESEKQTPQEDE